MIKTITNTQTVERMNSYTDRRNHPGSFDPVGFTVVPPRRFEDLRVGDVFRAPTRTLTDAHASAFQTVSADNHPIYAGTAVLARARSVICSSIAPLNVAGCNIHM
jgi:hypothetical protein